MDNQMKKITIKAIAALSLFAASAAHASAEEASDEEGFIPLFDGETLNGWTPSTDAPESFLVEEGNLIARGGPAHIYYSGDVEKAAFKNFELRLEVMTLPGSNSGVYFHTTYQKDGWPGVGYEAQVNSTAHDPRKTGSLYAVADILAFNDDKVRSLLTFEKGNPGVVRDKAPSRDNEWFDYVVIVRDKNISISVDGVETVNWTQPDDWDGGERKIGAGTIALQAHDPLSEVRYRNIRIKPLD
jgi:hypothetical protein